MQVLKLAVVVAMAAGCTSLKVTRAPVHVGPNTFIAVRIHGNMYGPGQSCLMLMDRAGKPIMMTPTCAAGPDAGVAFGTAGLQGAAIVGGAAVLGVSYPENKGVNVTQTGAANSGGAVVNSEANSASGSSVYWNAGAP